MKKNQFYAWSKLCKAAFFGAVALFMASCAVDGFDNDEQFASDVTNAQLESPAEDDITVTSSADGKSQTISWPVVQGAGGYLVSFYDEGNPDEYIVTDSIVDGCSITLKRDEDVNYVFVIQTLGDAAKNNTSAEEATNKKFTTFTPTYMTIPAGSDLNEWFAANPVPEEAITEMLNYDLEAGGEYTVSGLLDFEIYKVCLRTNDKSNHAKITYTSADATIAVAAQFNIKYLDFDCAMVPNNSGVFVFSGTSLGTNANELDPETFKWAGLYISEPVTFMSSNFENVGGYFFWDNSKKVCFETVLVDNVVCHLAPTSNVSGGVFWTNKGGQINNLTVSNSTFYMLPDCTTDYSYFYQAGGVGAQDVFNSTAATNSVNYKNSTFYHLTWNNHQWGNYNRMQGKAYSFWVMTDCIFWDCSTSGSVPRRFLHGQSYNQGTAGPSPNVTFNNNTYEKNDGTFQDPQNYDISGTNIEEDPQFANPAGADFTIGSGTTQAARKTGDPRWLP